MDSCYARPEILLKVLDVVSTVSVCLLLCWLLAGLIAVCKWTDGCMHPSIYPRIRA